MEEELSHNLEQSIHDSSYPLSSHCVFGFLSWGLVSNPDYKATTKKPSFP